MQWSSNESNGYVNRKRTNIMLRESIDISECNGNRMLKNLYVSTCPILKDFPKAFVYFFFIFFKTVDERLIL